MDIGQPEVFDSKDEGERLAYKLSSTFRRIWNNFGNINKQLSKTAATTSTIVNDHTSAMPDIHGVNPDHDKRYFRKSEIKNLVGNLYYLSAYSSLTAALAAIGSTSATLVIDVDGTKENADDIPSNISLFWINNKIINSIYNYTIRGRFINYPTWDCFTGVGVVTLSNIDTTTESSQILAVTDGQLKTIDGSSFGRITSVCFTVFKATTSVGVSIGVAAFTVPAELNTWVLTDVIASVYEKGVTGTTNVMVRRRRNGIDADMLSTAVTIGDEFYAHDEVVDTDYDDVSTGDQIYVDVDAVHTTPPKGLSVSLTFERA